MCQRFYSTTLLILCGLFSCLYCEAGAPTGTISASFTPSNTIVDIGENVTFTSNSTFINTCNSIADLTYDWDFGAGAIPPTAQEVLDNSDASNNHTNYNTIGNVAETVTYNSAGMKTVNLTITETGTDGACSNSPQMHSLMITVLADVPTLSEWGLILLALLLMNLGSVFIAQEKLALATPRNFKLPLISLQLPFSAEYFNKAVVLTAIFAFVGFAGSIALTGTIAASDLIGVFVTAPVFAYLVHLVWMMKGK